MIRQCGRILLLLIIGIALVIPALNCNNSGVVDSGGGIDIGNPTEFSVVDGQDRPIANASVRLIASDLWIDHVLEGKDAVTNLFTTDDKGIVRIDSIEAGNYNIQVDHDDGGAFVAGFTHANSFDSLKITIREYGTISGIINSLTSIPSQITLAGSAYTASVNGDGSYTLANVAGSTFVPMVMSVDSQWTLTSRVNVTSSAVSVYDREISFTTFMVEDFEDIINTSSVGGLLRRDGTYTKAGAGTAEYLIVSDAYLSSKALQGLLVREGAYALVGLSIGYKPDGDSLWDLSEATGFSFYGKGKGKLNISFESDTLDKLGFIKHYSADIVFGEEWQRISISFDTLSFYADNNPDSELPWSVCAKSVKRIEFNALEGDTARFWIDDLIVEGTVFSSVY